jgi:hypothetical protein
MSQMLSVHAPPPKKLNKVVINFNLFNDVWLVFDVKCYGYTKIGRKENVLDTKWDSTNFKKKKKNMHVKYGW